MTRGPKPRKQPEIIDVDVLPAEGAHGLAVMRQEAHAVRVLDEEAEQSVRDVAERLGYQLPADCVDADLIQRDISANMRRSVEACLEVGRGLSVLKAACPHGQFVARLDVLGIEESVARRFMQAAGKFSNRATSHVLLKAAGTQSKLFELMLLDDDQLDELAETGKSGNLIRDDIDAMTVRELKAAVRDARAESQAKDELLAERSKQIESERVKSARIAMVPPDQVLAELQAEVNRMANDLRGGIVGQLRQGLMALHGHAENGGESPPLVFMAGVIGQLEADLRGLRDEFGLPAVDRGELAWVDET